MGQMDFLNHCSSSKSLATLQQNEAVGRGLLCCEPVTVVPRGSVLNGAGRIVAMRTKAFIGILVCVLICGSNAQLHGREGVSLIEGTATQGILQLSYNGRTGLLCADNIGRNEGQVACHDLGLPDEYPSIRAVTAPSDAVFLGSNVRCQGNEVKLSDCRHDNWDTAACGSGEAAFVSCQTDPCTPSPCVNGACDLTSSELGYQCNCTTGWIGLLCDSDVNECVDNNGGCSELCVNVDGGYSCECPQQELELSADNHTCSAPGERVQCGSDMMEITFEKDAFPSLHREHLTLSDVSCGATDNVTHIILRAPLTTCGTVSQFSTTAGRFPSGQGQVSVYPGQDVHGQVTLTTVDPGLGLALSNCSATPTEHHNSTVTPYVVLQNGCVQDTTLSVGNVTGHVQQQFTMEAFKFLDNSPQVVFHCDVALCDASDDDSFCVHGCSSAS